MKTKLLLVVLVIICINTAFAQSVGKRFKQNGITYEITAIGTSPTTSIIASDNSAEKNVTIPNSIVYNDISYTVTRIGDYAFSYNNLTSVTIPDSVTSIGNHAFFVNQLTSVTIPNSVTSIGNYAFYSNKLTGVTIPDFVTTIGYYAFKYNNLVNITIKSASTVIGIEAFKNNNLNTITCVNEIPGILILKNSDVFDNRSNIDLIVPLNTEQTYLDANWTDFKTINNNTYYKQNVIKLNGITYIPSMLDGVNVLSVVDYDDSTGSNVTIPETIVSENITYTITFINNSAFYGNNLTSVIIPNSITSIGDYAFGENNLTSVTIPNSITTIGKGVFSHNSLTSVTIPNSVTSIGNHAFLSNGLANIDIPNSVTSIGDYAFATNYGLKSVTIPDTVTSIGAGAFSYTGLTSITIPDSVISIGIGAFSNSLLTHIDIPNSVTTIRTSTFIFNNNLTSVTIPNSVTTIEYNAFMSTKLTSVTIPNSVTTIENYAFDSTELTSVTCMGEVPATIDIETFYNRNNIDLIVPLNTTQAYLNAGWTDFKSITEQEVLSVDVTVLDEISITTNNNMLTINVNNNVTVVNVKIYTSTGSLVQETNQTVINTTDLSTGIYIVHIQTNNGIVSKKVLIP